MITSKNSEKKKSSPSNNLQTNYRFQDRQFVVVKMVQEEIREDTKSDTPADF